MRFSPGPAGSAQAPVLCPKPLPKGNPAYARHSVWAKSGWHVGEKHLEAMSVPTRRIVIYCGGHLTAVSRKRR